MEKKTTSKRGLKQLTKKQKIAIGGGITAIVLGIAVWLLSRKSSTSHTSGSNTSYAQQGYSSAADTVRTPTVVNEEIDTTPAPNFQPFTGIISTNFSDANVRAEPTTSSHIVSDVPKGAEVFVTGRVDSGGSVKGNTVWYATDQGGWIHSSLIQRR